MTHHEEAHDTFQPENFPALMEFLPAYLHEDFGEEYGSAAQAFEALGTDASGDQIQTVKEEWQTLRKALAHKPIEEFREALTKLGAAWNPQSERELQEVDEILSRTEA
jgi:hypothetical protein